MNDEELREHVAELVAAGQYLADVFRAGSASTYTVSGLAALEWWESARAALTAGADHG